MGKDYYVIVLCPDCKQEYTYGFVSAGAVIGGTVPEGECRICGNRVVATVVKLEAAAAVEDSPIKGWSR
jgi:hypothetical protein